MIHIQYDTTLQTILDPIRINLKLKELLNDYKVDKICVAENLSANNGGPGMTMLIGEHNLLCQIKIADDSGSDQICNMLNEEDLPLYIGLHSLQIENPDEISINNQGSYVIVSNQEMLQILKLYIAHDQIDFQQQKINIESMCILRKENLPVLI